MLLEILQNSQENTCARDSLLIKFQTCKFIRNESLVQVFSCELCEISKNTFFYGTAPLVDSVCFIKIKDLPDRHNKITAGIFVNFHVAVWQRKHPSFSRDL